MKKKYLQHLFLAMFAGAALLQSACADSDSEEKLPEPNFPVKTTLGIEIGGTCTIPIEPNQEWSVSIDQNEAGEWFWLDDDGLTAYTLRGKAGQHTITVCVSDKEEYDTDRSIDVSMTMGGQTQIIATVVRGTVERQFDLYAGEQSGFGEITYEEQPVDAAQTTLVIPWKENVMEPENLPIKIAANFPWRLDTKPEWIAEIVPSEGKAGETVEILLSGDPEAYPLEDTESELVFCDYNNNDVKYSFRISIPGCKDKELTTINQGMTYTFNAAGEYGKGGIGSTSWTLYGPTFQTTAAKLTTESGTFGYQLYVLEKKELFEGFYQYGICNWVEIHETLLSGNDVLVTTEYRLTADANPGSFRPAARSASVVLLPAELAKDVTSAQDLIEPDPNTYIPSLKEAYRPYELATITQDAPISSLFSVRDLQGMESSNTTFRQLTYAEDGALPEDMASIFGTPNEQNYLMTYTSENSYASVIYDQSLDGFTVRFFDEQFMPMQSASGWLSIRKDDAFVDSEGNAVTAQSFDILMENVSENKTGYAVLYVDNRPKAAICCKTDSGSSAGSFQAEITSDSPNSYLEPITNTNFAEMASMLKDAIGMDLKSEFEEKLAVGSVIYLLTSVPGEAITVTTTPFNPNYLQIIPYVDTEWLNAEVTSETTLNIKMDTPQGSTKYATINFYEGADYASGIIYCVPLP
ncbi:hypothetical protein [uncultured Alistipes sp.]|uniref:hypothetical protein n=1 Tax=uncultured Alistipes sp. TaxID=538949 RepID=UPI00261B6CA9|nr:hypothetical protein [uncultured Alistipes sp.]